MADVNNLANNIQELIKTIDELESLLDDALYQIEFYDNELQKERKRVRNLDTSTEYCFHETGNVVRRLKKFLNKWDDE